MIYLAQLIIHDNNKPILKMNLYDEGILRIIYIMQDGHLTSYEEVTQFYSPDIYFLDYLQLISAIPKDWKFMFKTQNISQIEYENNYECLVGFSKAANRAYNRFIDDIQAMQNKLKIVAKYAPNGYTIDDYINDFKNLYHVIPYVVVSIK